eukprot:TRINITY_DN3434_c1_g2_i1.p1 TRINITY_DN3434_c1_g2~~TRINITY_DN3434_c1_g2_i1.p1  ORF type:complete len:606 (+),score=97.74 TRINITY_DN3434_c1_g2_i1:76-1818(+)
MATTMMKMAAVVALTLLLEGVSAVRSSVGSMHLQRAEDNALRLATNATNAAIVGNKNCKTEVVCIVTSNQPFSHKGKDLDPLPALMEECLQKDPAVSIVAFAFQDYQGNKFPHYVKKLPSLQKGTRFKLRHKIALSGDQGEGHFCYSYFAGGMTAGAAAGGAIGFKLGLMAHIAGPIVGFTVKTLTTVVGAIGGAAAAHFASKAFGANCGGVVVGMYSLRKVGVEFDMEAKDVIRTYQSERTATTKKGTIVVRFGINGRQLVVASTHGTQGVRGKDKGKACDPAGQKYAKGVENEKSRVEDFTESLKLINELRRTDEITKDDTAGVLWGGDFNPRSVQTTGPNAGCPIWPAEDKDDEENLKMLSTGKDVIGDGVTFSEVLDGQALNEAPGLQCPTYKKEKPKTRNKMDANDKTERQFTCQDETGPLMYYKASHPPSWTDRIFYSTDADWLTCSDTHRIPHNDDHDAVAVVCTVMPGQECDASRMSQEERAEEHDARCCCTNADDCHLLRQDKLKRSWNPRKWLKGAAFCPGGDTKLHHWMKFGMLEMPERCVDELEGIDREEEEGSGGEAKAPPTAYLQQ